MPYGDKNMKQQEFPISSRESKEWHTHFAKAKQNLTAIVGIFGFSSHLCAVISSPSWWNQEIRPGLWRAVYLLPLRETAYLSHQMKRCRVRASGPPPETKFPAPLHCTSILPELWEINFRCFSVMQFMVFSFNRPNWWRFIISLKTLHFKLLDHLFKILCSHIDIWQFIVWNNIPTLHLIQNHP